MVVNFAIVGIQVSATIATRFATIIYIIIRGLTIRKQRKMNITFFHCDRNAIHQNNEWRMIPNAALRDRVHLPGGR